MKASYVRTIVKPTSLSSKLRHPYRTNGPSVLVRGLHSIAVRSLSVLILLAALLHPQPAFSVEAENLRDNEFLQKTVQAKNWKQLFAPMHGMVPTNVIREFEEAAKDLPFPQIRFWKAGLLFKESDGSHAYLRFGKHGKVYVNDREWKLDPLAPVQDEARRLSLFIQATSKGRSTFWQSLLPLAHAEEPVTSEKALAALAKELEYKSIECAGDDLSEEQQQDCGLMAVPTKVSAVASSDSGDQRKFMPIDLECPNKNNNQILTLTQKNKLGQIYILKVAYDENQATSVVVLAKDRGKSILQEKFAARITDQNHSGTSQDQEVAKAFLMKANPINRDICRGTKAILASYKSKLNANKNTLGQIENAKTSSSESTNYTPAF